MASNSNVCEDDKLKNNNDEKVPKSSLCDEKRKSEVMNSDLHVLKEDSSAGEKAYDLVADFNEDALKELLDELTQPNSTNKNLAPNKTHQIAQLLLDREQQQIREESGCSSDDSPDCGKHNTHGRRQKHCNNTLKKSILTPGSKGYARGASTPSAGALNSAGSCSRLQELNKDNNNKKASTRGSSQQSSSSNNNQTKVKSVEQSKASTRTRTGGSCGNLSRSSFDTQPPGTHRRNRRGREGGQSSTASGSTREGGSLQNLSKAEAGVTQSEQKSLQKSGSLSHVFDEQDIRCKHKNRRRKASECHSRASEEKTSLSVPENITTSSSDDSDQEYHSPTYQRLIPDDGEVMQCAVVQDMRQNAHYTSMSAVSAHQSLGASHTYQQHDMTELMEVVSHTAHSDNDKHAVSKKNEVDGPIGFFSPGALYGATGQTPLHREDSSLLRSKSIDNDQSTSNEEKSEREKLKTQKSFPLELGRIKDRSCNPLLVKPVSDMPHILQNATTFSDAFSKIGMLNGQPLLSSLDNSTPTISKKLQQLKDLKAKRKAKEDKSNSYEKDENYIGNQGINEILKYIGEDQDDENFSNGKKKKKLARKDERKKSLKEDDCLKKKEEDGLKKKEEEGSKKKEEEGSRKKEDNGLKKKEEDGFKKREEDEVPMRESRSVDCDRYVAPVDNSSCDNSVSEVKKSNGVKKADGEGLREASSVEDLVSKCRLTEQINSKRKTVDDGEVSKKRQNKNRRNNNSESSSKGGRKTMAETTSNSKSENTSYTKKETASKSEATSNNRKESNSKNETSSNNKKETASSIETNNCNKKEAGSFIKDEDTSYIKHEDSSFSRMSSSNRDEMTSSSKSEMASFSRGVVSSKSSRGKVGSNLKKNRLSSSNSELNKCSASEFGIDFYNVGDPYLSPSKESGSSVVYSQEFELVTRKKSKKKQPNNAIQNSRGFSRARYNEESFPREGFRERNHSKFLSSNKLSNSSVEGSPEEVTARVSTKKTSPINFDEAPRTPHDGEFMARLSSNTAVNNDTTTSAPNSDCYDSDGEGSVKSMPTQTTSKRQKNKKQTASSDNNTPQTSYANIAKMASFANKKQVKKISQQEAYYHAVTPNSAASYSISEQNLVVNGEQSDSQASGKSPTTGKESVKKSNETSSSKPKHQKTRSIPNNFLNDNFPPLVNDQKYISLDKDLFCSSTVEPSVKINVKGNTTSKAHDKSPNSEINKNESSIIESLSEAEPVKPKMESKSAQTLYDDVSCTLMNGHSTTTASDNSTLADSSISSEKTVQQDSGFIDMVAKSPNTSESKSEDSSKVKSRTPNKPKEAKKKKLSQQNVPVVFVNQSLPPQSHDITFMCPSFFDEKEEASELHLNYRPPPTDTPAWRYHECLRAIIARWMNVEVQLETEPQSVMVFHPAM